MQLIDSHCHLNMIDLKKFDGSLDNVVHQAQENQVEHILNISVNLTSFPEILATAKQYPNVYATVGIHPCYDEEPETTVEELCQLAQDPKVIGIGECGLDYHMNDSQDPKGQDFAWQRERFVTHIQAAKQAGMPLIIHTRDAIQDTLDIMKAEEAGVAGGIMHCYVEDVENAKKAMDLGFMISFSGIVTFKNAKQLHEVAKIVPDDKMLIETDSPYLAPMPHRGKGNQPAYVLHVAEHLANLRGTSVEHIAHVTRNNYRQLFGLN